MFRIVTQTVLGICIIVVGIYVGYLYLSGLNLGINPLFLLLSITFLGAGIFFLLRASRSNVTINTDENSEKAAMQSQKSSMSSDATNLFKKNNALVREWEETSNKRDKLKILGASAEDEK